MEYNIYFYAILIIVIGLFVLDFVANWLNVSAAASELPQEFQGVFDEAEYRKSQEYTRVTTWFGQFQDLVGLIVFLAFWLLGGFGWLDSLVRSWNLPNEVINGVVFMGLLWVGQMLISLPFDLYDTFVIEEKFGFNKTNLATFFGDFAKSILLAILLGGPILALLIWLFETFENAWLYGWLSVTAFSLLMMYLAPRLIMPLFNKFTPLEDGELKTEIENLATQCQFPLAEVSVIDGSRRSSKANAFFTGFGKNKRIALYDTLINSQSVPELLGVLAHEIGHFKKKHIVQQIVLSVTQMAIIFFLLKQFMKNEALTSAFGVTTPSVYCSFVFFTILFKPISRILSLGMTAWSRKNEFEADAYAVQVTGTANHLISALKKLSKENLSNLTPHPFYVKMYYTHPPVLERIEAMRKIAT